MQWYTKVLRNYVTFTGRARRTEYWMFVLFNFIILLLISILEAIMALPGVLSTLYSLAVFLPGLAVVVRRLHDSGQSGLWVLIGFVPVAGAIVLLVFMCLDSDSGQNRYGPNPKASI
ncbi:DUF805 domain-containing protein [Lentibacillus sp. CBA3610]|uniref:DUF805 domain-containing protein n=1 Tax=Lentibacillus sp. CBA3610 TaxID=2518176 RepID=UPI001595DAF1|nr:DUF805 domain-containing protein [Lentibacillus sp. CBA3610]QKY68399.1 DUF805 domain-containing protein [Lentibacillus sp. CBA3610]